jgi:hypothetical protein
LALVLIGGDVDQKDFIQLNFADVQNTIRAYDTKSQIVLASTAFSFNPILTAIRQFDVSAGMNTRVEILFVLFALVMLMFLRVLAPVSGASAPADGATGSLFFLRDPSGMSPRAYLDALSTADLDLEYANEVLALHRVRIVKSGRFKQALFTLVGYLVLVMHYGAAILAHAI